MMKAGDIIAPIFLLMLIIFVCSMFLTSFQTADLEERIDKRAWELRQFILLHVDGIPDTIVLYEIKVDTVYQFIPSPTDTIKGDTVWFDGIPHILQYEWRPCEIDTPSIPDTIAEGMIFSDTTWHTPDSLFNKYRHHPEFDTFRWYIPDTFEEKGDYCMKTLDKFFLPNR